MTLFSGSSLVDRSLSKPGKVVVLRQQRVHWFAQFRGLEGSMAECGREEQQDEEERRGWLHLPCMVPEVSDREICVGERYGWALDFAAG
jgi:hypothetical protein